MKLKASLHIHTKEDFSDGHFIKYTIYNLIDHAEELGFDVLALTGHRKFIYKPEYGDYAKGKGILLIPGIELSLGKIYRENHVIVLNCDKSVERVKTFRSLKMYKKKHPKAFIYAPHPTFGLQEGMGIKNLLKHIDTFDAIEHCWYHSKLVNFNKRSLKVAQQFNKPFIATADLHTLDYMDEDYVVVEATGKNIKAFFRAIKQGKYENVTRAKSIEELALFIVKLALSSLIKSPRKAAARFKPLIAIH